MEETVERLESDVIMIVSLRVEQVMDITAT
jgi:hypothetical protein